ncbi:MAG: dihydrolipoamide acetyltransferase family protein, partial [Planctomycetia bacterium]|nr:dihydrolipoamide acetyltransferase family protein [Planctomycetia bacterium]
DTGGAAGATEAEAPAIKPQQAPPAPRAKPPAEKAERVVEKPSPPPAAGERVAISPYARKLAEEKGIDFSRLKGSGPGGRITARDVEGSAAPGPAVKRKPPPAEEAPPSGPTESPPALRAPADEELPPLEVTSDEADVEEAPFRLRTQARRVTASKHVIPHFYIMRGADVTALMEKKEKLKLQYGATVTHLVMLACLKALKEHPEVNRSYDRGRIIKWKNVNLGLAVDTDQGLTVAVLRKARDMSLREIVERTGELVERARAGRLSADERRHPTFTISSLGAYDVEHFEPIINPPSAVTLAVASAMPSTVIRDDAIYIGKVMNLTLSCDHRIIDGVMAARFLKDLRVLLEDPTALLQGQ